jgi:hypothetical protein
MDGDDISHPRRLERQLALLESRPEVAVAGCRVEHFPKAAVGAGMARYEKWLNSLLSSDEIARDIFVESPLCHPSVVMRREAYDRAGAYLEDGTPEDYGLWLRMNALGFEMAKVDEVLFYWRDSPYRFSRNAEQYRADRFLSLKLRHIKSDYLNGRDTVAIWGAGKTGRRLSRGLERLDVRVASFIDIDPQKVGRRVHGAPVVSLPEKSTDVTAEALLVAVGSASARRQIRGYLTKRGFVELRDFICVA